MYLKTFRDVEVKKCSSDNNFSVGMRGTFVRLWCELCVVGAGWPPISIKLGLQWPRLGYTQTPNYATEIGLSLDTLSLCWCKLMKRQNWDLELKWDMSYEWLSVIYMHIDGLYVCGCVCVCFTSMPVRGHSQIVTSQVENPLASSKPHTCLHHRYASWP